MSDDPAQSRSNLIVVGVTISADMPVGVQHVRLGPGLNAFYGRNGVGKTRLLTELRRQLETRPVTVDPELKHLRGDENNPIPTPIAFYSSGGIHLRSPSPRFAGLAETLLESGEWFPADQTWTPFGRGDSQAVGTPDSRRLGITEETVRHFLALGRWFISPDLDRIYLCDPTPTDSPLTDRWTSSAKEWQALLEKEPLDDGAATLGRLRWTDDEQDSEPYWEVPNARLGPWEVSIPLLPLPEALGLPTAPDWVAYPVLCIPAEVAWRAEVVSDGLEQRARGKETIWGPITDLTVKSLPRNLNRAYLENYEARRRAAFESEDKGLQVAYSRPTLVHFEDALVAVVTEANLILAGLFDDPPILRCQRRPLSAWLEGLAPIVWEANTAINGPWFPPTQLGAAHLRYSLFAIERAIQQWTSSHGKRPTSSSSRFGVNGGTFALIDEPERALHVAAERRLADAVTSLGEMVLVSTHSTEFLEATFNGSGIAHRLEKRLDGSIETSSDHLSLDVSKRDAIAEQWGLTSARLATMTGAILFVEGLHDEAVISHFLADEIRRYRVVVLPLSGTKELHLVAMTELVFSTSDAPVVVCVDNSSHRVLARCESVLRSRRGQHARISYLDGLNRDPDFDTQEMKQLLILLRSAVRHSREERLHLFGLRARDIAEYLPVQLIDPRFNSWKELNTAFLGAIGRRSFRPGDGKSKKQWVNSNGGSYNVPGIRRALNAMSAAGATDSRHRDFEALAERVRTLVTTRR